jgi:N-acyl-D-amino-acid deacylase
MSIARRETDYSVVFNSATVVDGTRRRRFLADIALSGKRIAKIGAAGTLRGRQVVDARDRILAPGFVDIHSHADYTLLLDGRAHSSVLQGITSIVPGNCGLGVAPITDTSRSLVSSAAWRKEWDIPSRWTSFGDYMNLLRERGVGPNVFPLVPHGTLRLGVSGFSNREVTASELDRMKGLAAEAMAAGAVGLSTGLEYAPGIAATTEEIAAVAEPVGKAGGFYATHCRNRSERMVEAAQEAITVCEQSGCRLEMSHFIRRPTGPGPDVMRRAVELVRDADGRGIRSRFDVFPFDYGPSPLTMFIPMWVSEGGPAEAASRLQDPKVRARILNELSPRFVAMLQSGIAADMYVASDGIDGELVGKSLGEIASDWEMSVAEASLGAMARAGENYHDVVIVERWVDWNDLLGALRSADFLIMGDGVTAGLDGPLAGYGFSLSDWGYAPAMLGKFVRDDHVTELEDAIWRMTAEPAEQAALRDRGKIQEGYFADLVVFDAQVIGSAVRPDALTVPPTGVQHVLVNGEFVVRDGRATNARPGVVGRNLS